MWTSSVLLLILLAPVYLFEKSTHASVIVWNVGQGQWITLVDDRSCTHFDVGGERIPIRQIQKNCREKENRIFLTHWDWDHIQGLKLIHSWPNICLDHIPAGSGSFRKVKLVQLFQKCKTESPFQPLFPRGGEELVSLNSNELSEVYQVHNVLIPGDSTMEMEKKWSPQVSKNLEFLVLGHHGSSTSTSQQMLMQIPRLRLAIASARWLRYHHPHFLTVQRLKRNGIPVLSTEDWGNIGWFIK